MSRPSPVTILEFEGVTLTVLHHPQYGPLIPTAQVAAGYGVTPQAIDGQFARRRDELEEGRHYVLLQQNVGNLSRTVRHWTQRGVVALGFFLNGERAKRFRRWAEDLVLEQAAPQPPSPALPSSPLELLELSLQALKEQDRRVAALEATTRQLVDDRATLPISLFPQQKGALHRALQKLGRLEGNYSRVYRDFHERYGLASYADLPRNRYEEALAYVNGRIAACQAGGALLEEA